MRNKEADRLSLETGCMPIEFKTDGLFVFFEPQYKKRIVIAGIHGTVIVTGKQIGRAHV